jgi:hypothetical protein
MTLPNQFGVLCRRAAQRQATSASRAATEAGEECFAQLQQAEDSAAKELASRCEAEEVARRSVLHLGRACRLLPTQCLPCTAGTACTACTACTAPACLMALLARLSAGRSSGRATLTIWASFADSYTRASPPALTPPPFV